MSKRANKAASTVPAAEATEGDVAVLDFRNPSASLFRRFIRLAFGFIMVNYLFYGMVLGAILAALCWTGPVGIIASFVFVLAYLPSFLSPYQVCTPLAETSPLFFPVSAAGWSRAQSAHCFGHLVRSAGMAACGLPSVTCHHGSLFKSIWDCAWYVMLAVVLVYV